MLLSPPALSFPLWSQNTNSHFAQRLLWISVAVTFPGHDSSGLHTHVLCGVIVLLSCSLIQCILILARRVLMEVEVELVIKKQVIDRFIILHHLTTNSKEQ